VVLGCLVACLVALGRAGWSVDDLVDEQTNPQTQRDEVMAAAQSFATVVFKYGPDDLDEQGQMPGYVERVEKLMTSKFATEFEEGVAFAEQSVAQGKISREAEVYATGVSRLDEDSARVMVAVVETYSVADPEKGDRQVPYDEQAVRYEVELVLTGGEWLVDAFGPLGALDADPDALPSPAPTSAPPSSGADPGGDGGDGQ
jgi:Mce-associated membrane protein